MTNGIRPVPRTFLGRGSNWYKKCFGTKYKKLENISFCTKTPNQNNLVFLYQPEPFVLVHFFRKNVKNLESGKKNGPEGESGRSFRKRTAKGIKVDGSSHESGRSKGWKSSTRIEKIPYFRYYRTFVSIWNKWMNYDPDRNLEGTLTLVGCYPDFDLKVNLTRI